MVGIMNWLIIKIYPLQDEKLYFLFSSINNKSIYDRAPVTQL